MINQEKTLELVDRSQRKDTTAFAQLVTEFQPMVFRLAFRLLCDEDEARDITQETFVKVWLSLKTYNRKNRFSTWLYKITCNACYDRLRLDIFNGIFGRLPYVEVCTERFPDAAYTASEYLDDIYGIVWEGVLKHRPLENFERALQTAFLESIISTSTATAPIGSFKASKTGFAATGKPEINLAALRNGGKVDMKMYSLQNAEEVAGFSSIPPIYTNQTKIAAYYFDLLMRTKDMLKKAISTAPEADRSHYDLLIYRINKATEIE